MRENEIIFRVDKLMDLCTDKTVLHLGYIQHSHLYEDLIKQERWVHQSLSQVSKKIIGIDYLEKDVNSINHKYGYEGYCGDAQHLEKVNLTEKFDVIVCGELIEHITNPGLMLEGVKRFMHSNSILVITTPNAWGYNYLETLKRDEPEETWVNEEHITWYTFFTLSNTLKRHNFKEVDFRYYYGFNRKVDFYEGINGFVGFIKKLKRLLILSRLKKQYQEGLFFIAKL